MVSKTIISSDVSSSTGCTLTPPDSPTISPASSVIFLRKTQSFFQKARELIATHLIYAWGDPDFLLDPTESQSPEGVNATNSIAIDDEDTLTKSIATEESTEEPIKYKTFNEVWDSKAYKYTLKKLLDKADEVNELDQYVFVVRRRIDKNATDISFRIDIKSRYLRETLQSILKDVRGISLKEDNLCVEQNLLYHYLYNIQSYQNCSIGEERIKHVTLLSEYIETTYDDTTQRLLSLLRNGEITYDLLWALFPPNDITYTRCFGTQKSRCFSFSSGVEKTSIGGTKYWNIKGRYLDFDGEGFGEVEIELYIAKFDGAKKIHLLEAFPLQYHPNKNEVQTELLKRGRKFVSLKGACHRYCRGIAFVMKEGIYVKAISASPI